MPKEVIDIRGQLVEFDYTDEADLNRQAQEADNFIAQEQINSSLRPKFQNPPVLPQGEPTSNLVDFIKSGATDLTRALSLASGNLIEGAANVADRVEASGQSLARSIFGQEQAPLPDTTRENYIAPAPGNVVSNAARSIADELFSVARQREAEQEALNVQPSVTAEQVFDDPLSLKTGRYILEQGAQSLPDMATALVPFVGLPTLATAQSQRIAEERQQNLGLSPLDVTAEDLFKMAPFAMTSAALERVGAKGVVPSPLGGVEEVAKTAGGRVRNIAKAAGEEAATEAAQEQIEMQGALTNTGVEPGIEARLKRSAAAALVGAGVGGVGRGGAEATGAAVDSVKSRINKAGAATTAENVDDANVVNMGSSLRAQPERLDTQQRAVADGAQPMVAAESASFPADIFNAPTAPQLDAQQDGVASSTPDVKTTLDDITKAHEISLSDIKDLGTRYEPDQSVQSSAVNPARPEPKVFFNANTGETAAVGVERINDGSGKVLGYSVTGVSSQRPGAEKSSVGIVIGQDGVTPVFSSISDQAQAAVFSTPEQAKAAINTAIIQPLAKTGVGFRPLSISPALSPSPLQDATPKPAQQPIAALEDTSPQRPSSAGVLPASGAPPQTDRSPAVGVQEIMDKLNDASSGRVPVSSFTGKEQRALEDVGVKQSSSKSGEPTYSVRDIAQAVKKEEFGQKTAPQEESTSTMMDNLEGGDTVPPPSTPGVGGTDARSNQFGFIAQAFTDRPSWQRSIFTDAGYDADKAINFAPERQAKIMRRAILDKFGISVDIAADIPLRQALDQMSDLYANLQHFAYVLNLPESAMSLTGKKEGNRPNLMLRLLKKAPYLGVFYPRENMIALPARSNSFAHEWGHALDFFMLEQIEDSIKYEGMSGKIRNAGGDYTPGTASEAWVNLMQSIFFEKDALAAELVRLEAAIEKTTSEKQRADLTKRIEAIKSGQTKIRSGRTDYYKKASSIGTSYWTKPTEMLARSFEAYIAAKVTAAGGSLEVLSKTDKGYMSGADQRFVDTFPKAVDRDNIFRAYDMLFENMQAQSILNPDKDPLTVPTAGRDYLSPETIWSENNQNPPPSGLRGLVTREIAEYKRQARVVEQERSRPKNDRDWWDRIRNGIGYVASSDQAIFRMMEGRYPAARSIRFIANMYAKRPGSGEFSGFIDDKGKRWGTYEEETDRVMTENINTMLKILSNNNLDETNVEQMDQLREAMLGMDQGKPANITKAAGQLRRVVYDKMWAHGKAAGIDIGFVKDIAFLNRVYDIPVVATKQEQFLDSAGKVYSIQFNNMVGIPPGADVDTVLEMFQAIDSMLQASGRDPKYKTKGRGANPVVKAIKSLMKQLSETEDEKQRQRISKEIQDHIRSIYAELRNDYSELSAEAWLQNLLSPSVGIEGYNPPRASFTKSRALPAEADIIMKDFMINNPVELMHTYISGMATEAAYQRRKARTDAGFKSLAKEGVHRDDIETMAKIVESVTGRATRDFFGQKTHTFFNGMRALGTLYLLPRAVFASIPEAMTLGIRTGNSLDGLRAMALTIKDIVSSSESTQDRMRFAQEIGLISNALADQAIANRIGGTYDNSPRWNRLVHNLFERTMLGPLTRKQHAVVIAIGDVYVRRLAKYIVDARAAGDTGQKSKFNSYVSDLVELGIPRSEVEAFSKWMVDKQGERVTNDEIANTPNGQVYRIALDRLRSEAVQKAAAVERSSFAKSDIGKVVLGITSFMFAYFENIVKATPKRVWRTYLESGASPAMQRAIAGYLPAMLQLWLAHTAVMALRTALFNPDRLEEWDKEGDLAENLMLAGMSQMGLMGPGADIFVNALEGVRYQRDIANVAVGPYAGTFLQNFQKAIRPGVANNSPKTNTTEFGSLQGAYGLMAPVISWGLNYAPAGPITGRGLGLINMYATSGAASEHFATAVIGEKGSKTGGNFERGKEK